MKINYNILFGCLIISIGIIIHGYITKQASNEFLNVEGNNSNTIEYKKVLDLTDAAEYLNMTESEVKSIIRIESKILSETHNFSGVRLSYFQIDKKYYFCKEELDRWIVDAVVDKREYGTEQGYMLR